MSFCNKCGSKQMEEANFCHKCGAKLSNIEKISFIEPKHADAQTDENSNKKRNKEKRRYNSTQVGILAGLIVLLVGFGSYYVCSSILSADATKKTNAYPKIIPKSNNDSKNDTTTSTDKNQSNVSKSDTDKNSIESRISSSDNYIFPKSKSEKLLDSDLSSISKENLALARNEIFARHGLIFQTEPYKSYFQGKSWYKPNSNFKDRELNDIEKYNIELILKHEKK
jgi:hypothetical protein